MVAAGCKKIGLVDDDIIEKSNLTRQFIYRDDDIGKKKSIVLKNSLMLLRPKISVCTYIKAIKNVNDLSELDDYDLIIVSADNPSGIAFTFAEYILNKPKSSFINIGYIQDIGVWGPIVDANHAKLFITRMKEILGFSVNHNTKQIEEVRKFNSSYQAPSFGPLNQMVVGMASEIF